MVVRYVGIVAIVAVFCIFLFTWDESAPVVAGWTDLSNVASSDPDTGFPQAISIMPPETGICEWWDVGCYTGNLAGALLYIGAVIGSTIGWFFAVIGWFFMLVFAFFSALFGSVTLTMDGMPPDIQTLMLVIVIPLAVMLILFIIRLVRGNEG